MIPKREMIYAALAFGVLLMIAYIAFDYYPACMAVNLPIQENQLNMSNGVSIGNLVIQQPQNGYQPFSANAFCHFNMPDWQYYGELGAAAFACMAAIGLVVWDIFKGRKNGRPAKEAVQQG